MHQVPVDGPGRSSGAKVGSKHHVWLFPIGLAAVPTRFGAGIRAIHMGNENIGPIDAFDVFCENCFGVIAKPHALISEQLRQQPIKGRLGGVKCAPGT
jgi:hypothetical protein